MIILKRSSKKQEHSIDQPGKQFDGINHDGKTRNITSWKKGPRTQKRVVKNARRKKNIYV